MSKAGPALLIRIRINVVSVSNMPYCVFLPYLPYLTVAVIPKIRIYRAKYDSIYRISAENRITPSVERAHG